MAENLFDPLAAPYTADGDPMLDGPAGEERRRGDEAVVLIHGFTGTPAHLKPLAEEINAAGYAVRVPLLAGHGTTIEDLATTGAQDWVTSARLALATVTGHRRVHLVGLSMGGLIGMILAAEALASTSPRRPRIASLTTIDTPILVRDPRLYLAPLAQFVMPTVSWPEEDPGIEPEMVPYWLGYSGFHSRGAASLLRVMSRAVPAARRVDVPALVIQSRTDETVHPHSAALWPRLLAGPAHPVMLERSKHVATLDRERGLITRSILDHLDAAAGRRVPAQ